jgi:hypothetical protein
MTVARRPRGPQGSPVVPTLLAFLALALTAATGPGGRALAAAADRPAVALNEINCVGSDWHPRGLRRLERADGDDAGREPAHRCTSETRPTP